MTTAEIKQHTIDTLIERVRFESAMLRFPGHSLDAMEADTALIREATKQYVETWIVPQLRALASDDYETLKRIL